jgi:hypothetical protein
MLDFPSGPPESDDLESNALSEGTDEVALRKSDVLPESGFIGSWNNFKLH